MKAWWVTVTGDQWDYSDIVHAETPGQAKIKSWMYTEEGIDFIELRVRREPKLDDMELTQENIHNAGYAVYCTECDDWSLGGGEMVFKHGKPYHEQCLARLEAKAKETKSHG